VSEPDREVASDPLQQPTVSLGQLSL